MRTRLILLCAAVAVAFGAAPSPAPAAERSPHIAFGTPLADSTAAPWAALLQRQRTDGSYALFCTANVVNATTILTAAHCVVDEATNQIIPATAYRIQVGGVAEDQPGAQVVATTGVAVHPLYRGFEQGYDVAVLTLATPLNFGTPFVQPIGVAKPNSTVRTGKALSFFGWGTTETGAPQGLRGMTTKAILPALCAPGQPGILCAFNRAQAPCGGDSGGGLVRTRADGVRELVGLDSYGGQECKPGQPDGFADLTQPAINSWIGGVLTGQAVNPKAGPRASKRPKVRRVSSASTRLRCSSASWSGKPKVRTQWIYDSGKTIARTRRPYYTAKRKDVGKLILCVSNAKTSAGSAGIASRLGYRFSFIPR